MKIPESESIEIAALKDLHIAADSFDIQRLGLTGRVVGATYVSVARKLPATAIVINRAVGLGFGEIVNSDQVGEIVSLYRKAEVCRYFIQVLPEAFSSGLTQWLDNEGLEKGRGWQKFSRHAQEVTKALTTLDVRFIDHRHGTKFAEIVCNAFDIGNIAVPWLAKLPERKGWHICMSFEGDRPAGVGALFVKDGVGWMDFGATSPECRRRGSQGAVMAQRLELANQLGCRKVFTCTGVPVPGDLQHSYRNILKAGFIETCVRENYEPACPEAS